MSLCNMRYICVVCFCSIISTGNTLEPQFSKPQLNVTNMQDPQPPAKFPINSDSSPPTQVKANLKLEFPVKEVDVSTPILVGDDPKKSKLPPKIFPTKQVKNPAGPSIVSSVEVKNTDIHHDEQKLNLPNQDILEKVNVTSQESTAKADVAKDKLKQTTTVEQDDMLHSKYKGGQDVDELHPQEKKVGEKDEKKVAAPTKDPKTEVSVSSTMDKNGPKLMNDTKTKSGESMLESTSKMMAVSSSVFANTQSKQHGIIEPGKTIVSVILTVVALLCFGVLGLLVWKRIAMRRFGRDVLINEDDFDEVADMHTFDRAQIQIT